ncbi:unnamed protein product [Pleuronectes platessa]|uniref:Uncharacterized protein n=1 Tax=Pleuronectes platessa TaxID=8262 RepID=A0A9N7VWQ9_PLEPL|nr:unnamed protein product [Pleuronectes platessa]
MDGGLPVKEKERDSAPVKQTAIEYVAFYQDVRSVETVPKPHFNESVGLDARGMVHWQRRQRVPCTQRCNKLAGQVRTRQDNLACVATAHHFLPSLNPTKSIAYRPISANIKILALQLDTAYEKRIVAALQREPRL